MFDQRFFASKVGLAAVVSVAAMVSFNLFAFSQRDLPPSARISAAVTGVELA